MRESTVEGHLRLGVNKTLNGIAYKFKSPARANVPDRLCVIPMRGGLEALVFFVECKRPGEKPRPGQLREIKRLRERGARVFVVDCKEQVDALINNLQRAYQ